MIRRRLRRYQSLSSRGEQTSFVQRCSSGAVRSADRQLKLPLPPPRKADLLAVIRDRLAGYEVRQAAREARRRGIAKRRALRAQGLLAPEEDRQLLIPGLEAPAPR